MKISNNVKYLGGVILLVAGIYLSIKMMNNNMRLVEGMSKNEEEKFSDNLYKKINKLEKRVKNKKAKINLDDYSDDILKIIELQQEEATLDAALGYCRGKGDNGLFAGAIGFSDGVEKLKARISGGSNESSESSDGGSFW